MKTILFVFLILMSLVALSACDPKNHPSDPPDQKDDQPSSRIGKMSTAEVQEVRARLLKSFQDGQVIGSGWLVAGSFCLRMHLQSVLNLQPTDFDDPNMQRDFLRLFQQFHDANGGIREK